MKTVTDVNTVNQLLTYSKQAEAGIHQKAIQMLLGAGNNKKQDSLSISATYNFTIGNPKYTLGSYTHTFKSTTLAAKGTWQDKVDLTLITSIPDGAIGYKISIGGCTSSVSSKRYFYNEFYDQWVATKSTYSYSLPVTNSSLLDQVWGAKIVSTSSSSKTFSPTMTIRYVAPDLP